jgi:hypothetical protein
MTEIESKIARFGILKVSKIPERRNPMSRMNDNKKAGSKKSPNKFSSLKISTFSDQDELNKEVLVLD